jgi:hypothetical protein
VRSTYPGPTVSLPAGAEAAVLAVFLLFFVHFAWNDKQAVLKQYSNITSLEARRGRDRRGQGTGCFAASLTLLIEQQRRAGRGRVVLLLAKGGGRALYTHTHTDRQTVVNTSCERLSKNFAQKSISHTEWTDRPAQYL